MRRAKIVCTLGPASATQEAIDALVAAGMDCARLNFSHGTHESHAKNAAMVRRAAARAGRPLAILADLCGPKMRVGKFPGGPIELVEGARFTLSTDPDTPGDGERVGVTYEPLARDVKAGDDVLLDDGLLRLRVVSTDGKDVVTEVIVGGTLSDSKGLNVPGAELSTPALTDKDKEDLAFAVGTLQVEYVALSFVRSAGDVLEAQALAKGTPVIAKLEKPEAIANLGAILDAADGAMVARGDLGVEMGAEKVPLLQKRIIREVNARSKLVITATQMLDSMIRNPTPTRAEAADVANAVLDGSDALMLSGETAAGRHPQLAVGMMDRIIREVEGEWLANIASHIDPPAPREWGFADAAAKAAAVMSFALPLKALVVFTRDGRTVNLLSEHRPRAPIVALTQNGTVANRLALEWGVIPRIEVPPEIMSDTVRIATGLLLREGICKVGDDFALVMGWPPTSATNTLKLHRI
ncbi:MAG: pyruvate kinase [Myxococcales bacterium]|nr:pyruvate kinase [Myxococcales bacterium]MCB9731753.1 pyruvate kinase [Deltaproteobacteria bacterium]